MKEIDDYLANVDEKRQATFRKLYETVRDNLPVGFEEEYQKQVPTKLNMGKVVFEWQISKIFHMNF